MSRKYAGWEHLFQSYRVRGERKFQLTFAELEDALDNDLPDSARSHAAWWSGKRPHIIWRQFGYRASPKLNEEIVNFELVEESISPPAPRTPSSVVNARKLTPFQRLKTDPPEGSGRSSGSVSFLLGSLI